MAKNRKCSNCVFKVLLKTCSGRSTEKPCSQWLYKKANCRRCLYLIECAQLGKYVGEDHCCLNFKRNKNPPDKIQDAFEEEGNKDELFDDGPPTVQINPRKEKTRERKLEFSDEEQDDDFFSPVQLIEDVISTNYDPASFAQVDESDIPFAVNPLQFVLSEKFLNINLFPKQLIYVADFFNCYCPYCSDVKWLANEVEVDTRTDDILDKMTLYRKGYCRKCGSNKFQAQQEGLLKPYSQLIGVAGQRSGKSVLTAILSATILHMYLRYPNPIDFLGLINTTLHGTFVGLNFHSAKDNLWEPFNNILETSPWYQMYHDFLKRESNDIGRELFKHRETFLVYNHKHLTLYPSGPDKRKLRGRTRFMCCLVGNSLVNTGNGLKRIDSDLTGNTVHVNNELHPVSKEWFLGKENTIKITMDKGYSIEATKEHKILTFNSNLELKWVKAENIDEETYVVMNMGGNFPSKLDINYIDDYDTPSYKKILHNMKRLKRFTAVQAVQGVKNPKGIYSITHNLIKKGMLIKKEGKERPGGTGRCLTYETTDSFDVDCLDTKHHNIIFPKKMTKELGYLLGYLVSEGNYAGISTEITFSNTNKNIVDHFIHCFESVFGILPNIGNSYKLPSGKEYWQIRTSNRRIKLFLEYLGLKPTNSDKKEIPWSILQSPKNVIICFLRALYEGDGSYSEYKIDYTSYSQKLLKQLQILLLRFYVVTDRSKNCLTTASKYDKSMFMQNIGGVNKHKKVSSHWNDVYAKHYRVPYIKYNWARSRNSGGYIYVKSELNKIFDNYPLNRLYNEMDERFAQGIENIIDSGMFFLKVKNIKEQEREKKVYDIQVDSSQHSYVANGIIVHNSIDEIGWFIGSEGSARYDPDEVYAALDNSLITVLTAAKKQRTIDLDVPLAYGLYISSPRSKTDKSMRMWKQSLGSNVIYGYRGATWDINPNITKDDLIEKYREDPVGAERDFGANPPFSAKPYIPSAASIVPLFSKKGNVIKLKDYNTVRDSLGGTLMYPKISFKTKHTFPSILAIDAGYNNNSFAFILMHYMNNEKVGVSGVLEIIPNPYPLSFPQIYENVIKAITQEFDVRVVAFDRWQSLDLSQRIFQDLGIESFSYSVKMDDFQNLRTRLYSSNIVFPKLDNELDDLLSLNEDVEELVDRKPTSHLFLQLLMSQDNGNTVTKGDDVTDDLLRALCLGHSILTSEDHKQKFKGEGRDHKQFGLDSIAVSQMLSSYNPNNSPTNQKPGQPGAVPGIGVSNSVRYI